MSVLLSQLITPFPSLPISISPFSLSASLFSELQCFPCLASEMLYFADFPLHHWLLLLSALADSSFTQLLNTGTKCPCLGPSSFLYLPLGDLIHAHRVEFHRDVVKTPKLISPMQNSPLRIRSPPSWTHLSTYTSLSFFQFIFFSAPNSLESFHVFSFSMIV